MATAKAARRATTKSSGQKRARVPTYRQRAGYAHALVTLTDSATGKRRDYWLGPHGSPESREAYHRVLAEWEANGRRFPDNRLSGWRKPLESAGATPPLPREAACEVDPCGPLDGETLTPRAETRHPSATFAHSRRHRAVRVQQPALNASMKSRKSRMSMMVSPLRSGLPNWPQGGDSCSQAEKSSMKSRKSRMSPVSGVPL